MRSTIRILFGISIALTGLMTFFFIALYIFALGTDVTWIANNVTYQGRKPSYEEAQMILDFLKIILLVVAIIFAISAVFQVTAFILCKQNSTNLVLPIITIIINISNILGLIASILWLVENNKARQTR